jgi:hypothetical protein
MCYDPISGNQYVVDQEGAVKIDDVGAGSDLSASSALQDHEK